MTRRSVWLLALAACLGTRVHAEDPAPKTDFVPEIAKAAAAQGNAAFARKDITAARRAYERVLELAPDNLLGLVNLGVVEFTAGNRERAEELLKKAIQIRIETPPAWLTLGIIYMDGERYDEALAALSQAVVLDPRNSRARNYLGVVIGRKGWIDGAQSELRRAVELDPTYSDAQYNLAAFYLEEKPPAIELARRHYYRAVELGAAPDPGIEKVLNSTPPKH
jgi:tetratricopeptide (TPR) repeat protein